MSISEPWPFALGGGPLLGDRWMRHIYLDETGTDKKAAYALVAGVIVDVDKQWREAAGRLTTLRDKHVPESQRAKFVFHASYIMRGSPPFDDRDVWPIARRVEVICEVLDIIRELRLPVSLAWVAKEPMSIGQPDGPKKPGAFGKDEIAHAIAFTRCLSAADFFIRQTAEDEIFTAIAEREERLQWLLSTVPLLLDIMAQSNPNFSPLGNIINAIQFQGKRDAPLLQLADHAAFAWRHYRDQNEFGSMFRARMGGTELGVSSQETGHPVGTRIIAHLS